MNKIFTTFLLFLICSLPTFAYDVELDGIYYNLDQTEMTASVTDNGNYGTPSYDASSITIPEVIKVDGNNYTVTSVEDMAFMFCDQVTSITLPKTIKKLGGYCFSACYDLTTINIPEAVTSLGTACFQYCTSLSTINLPNSVTKLGNGCFYGCSSLTSIQIPASVKSIGVESFSMCANLAQLQR